TILSNDDIGDAVEHDRAAAHGTWRERRIDRAGAVHACGPSSRVLERVHFAVQDGAATLDSSIVAPADDLILIYEHGTDWNAAFRQPLPRFVNRRLEEPVHS